MKHHYNDIVKKMTEQPKWWDENGTPRYCDFAPDEVANVYAKFAFLVEIECQNCEQRFQVAVSADNISKKQIELIKNHESGKRLAADFFGYGDPPNAGCCGSGPTMDSNTVKVIEFWQQNKETWKWERCPELEIEINEQDA